MADPKSVVSAWIAARELGDVEQAAAMCHQDFAFTSPQLSARGLDLAKERLFPQAAPKPLAVHTPLQTMKDQEEVVIREVSFRAGNQSVLVRQTFTMLWDDCLRCLIGNVSVVRIDAPMPRPTMMSLLGLPDLPRIGGATPPPSPEKFATPPPREASERRTVMSMMGLPDLPSFGGEAKPAELDAVDSEFKRPFTTAGPSSPPKKKEEDAENFNEFNFWKAAAPSFPSPPSAAADPPAGPADLGGLPKVALPKMPKRGSKFVSAPGAAPGTTPGATQAAPPPAKYKLVAVDMDGTFLGADGQVRR